MKATMTTEESIKLLEEVRGGKLTFGSMVQAFRKCEDWSPSELAAKLQVGTQWVTMLEDNALLPTQREVKELAEVFGMSVDQWLTLLGYPPHSEHIRMRTRLELRGIVTQGLLNDGVETLVMAEIEALAHQCGLGIVGYDFNADIGGFVATLKLPSPESGKGEP